MGYRKAATLMLIWAIAPARAGWSADGGNRVHLEPQTIGIGIFYSGQTVRVTTTGWGIEGAAIRVVGPSEPLTLKKKGKKFGLLWMNVGEVRYQAVPTLYLVRSSGKLKEMAPPEVLEKCQLGFDALEHQITRGLDAEACELFGELVKLKARDGLFSVAESDVVCAAADAGRRLVRGRVFLPAKAPPGDYQVAVFGFRHGEATRLGGATIHVRQGSFVGWVSGLAQEHGLMYGCLAVAIAVGAGLLAGYVFGMGKGASH